MYYLHKYKKEKNKGQTSESVSPLIYDQLKMKPNVPFPVGMIIQLRKIINTL